MKTNLVFVCLALMCTIGARALPDTCAQTSTKAMLETAEVRLRAIYEKGEFRAQRFRADWLPDSSGYTLRESVPGTEERVLVRYEVASGKRTVLETPQEGADRSGELSPDGKHLLYRDEGNLYVRNLQNDQVTPLTSTAPDGPISHGRAVWSPDGQGIAFVQSDASAVKLRSMLVPGDPSYPGVREVRFARVGDTISTLRVGVVDALGKEMRWLSLPMPAEGFYLGQVGWAGNSHELLVEKLSRSRDEREFLLANVDTGAVTRIFYESDPAWVMASYRKNAGLVWIRDGDAFLVLSEKEGWRRAYVYSRAGEALTCLTPDAMDIIERVLVDEARGLFYFYASPENGTQKYLYRVALDGSEAPTRVTPPGQAGTHNYEFSPDARWAFHTYSSFDTPPVTELVELPSHRVLRVLEDNSELRQKMAPLISRPTEFLQLDIGDGVVVDAWMIKPREFDSTRKYPVFVYVYGEPHGQTVLDGWGRSQADYHRVIADLGYLVVSIDNRGTPAPKGATWRRCIFGSLGPLSTDEQAAAILELGRTRSYVDLSRVGIWGWSGGGSNTLNAMFRKPDVYQLGIAVAPKPQPHLYNAWFQEIYMRTRELNPEGYQRSAPINFAEGLAGDLLIIHGTGETNTHLQITEGLVDRLIELGKRFDYMAYPNRNHGLREGAGTALHLRMLMTRYLIEHLAPGPQ